MNNNTFEQTGLIELSCSEIESINGGIGLLAAAGCIGMACAVLYKELMRY